MVRYLECQKNHAAHMGGHVLDGCGEFMPAGEDGTPLALKCAACDCHRNFHRREAEVGSSTAAPPPPPPSSTTRNCYISFTNNNNGSKAGVIRPHASRAPVMMAFGGGGGAAESSSEDQATAAMMTAAGQYGSLKKRFRTKFTQEQKEKMMDFAEKIGWKIQKQDESDLQRFCQEVGVKRQVFKVWLHNNKQASKRKQSE